MVPFGYPIWDGMMKNGTGEPRQRHLLIYVLMSSENISDAVYGSNFYLRKCNAADFCHIYSMNLITSFVMMNSYIGKRGTRYEKV